METRSNLRYNLPHITLCYLSEIHVCHQLDQAPVFNQ